MKSYWIESEKEKEGYKALNKDIETDICIIGGGITGITTAYYLNQYKIKNIILEKDRICQRTSGHSTAKITSQHGLFYKYLIDSQGIEFAKQYYEANQQAIENINEIIQKENIECSFERQSAYIFTQKIEDVQKIKDEVEAVKSFGGTANYIEAQNIEINKINKENDKKIKALAAIEFPNQAQFNPYQYVSELAKKCEQGQTQIYENSKVMDIEKTEHGYIVNLENGTKVRAKYIVIATKYPIINFPGMYFLKMYQSTSNVIVIDPKIEKTQEKWENKLFEGMYINSEDATISLRTIQNNGKELIAIAGFDHKTGAKIDLQNGYDYLEKIAKSLYPNCEIKYRWNTEDCISLDKIPYIGEFSNVMPRIYVATGYNKWGITSSNIAANIIVDKIMGIENPYEEIFRATRLEPIKNHKEMGNIIKESIHSLFLNKLNMPKESENQIGNDQGGIVEINGEKVGIYKDSQGEIFKVKPICQHLGCELSWNNLDKTWDCPCHGSRYTYKGEIIYGPSVKNLEKYE